MTRGATHVEIDGRPLVLGNLEKVLWPAAGFTKAHLIDYYRRIAPALLPHLRDRALTMKRYPDGVEGPYFYEKNCPEHAPEWIRRHAIYSGTREGDIRFCVVDDLATLVWTANMADLELHPYLSKVDDPQTPTTMVFDLDPGPGTDVVDCARVALALRAKLDDLGLQGFAKTSGSKGMQLYVPLHSPASFEETKTVAHALGRIVARDDPRGITTNMRKSEREGRVLVDWAQNDDHKTTVCVYSLRAQAHPTVSTPLSWAEVEKIERSGDASLARFLPSDVLARVERHGDLFEPVLTLVQALPGRG